MAHSEISLHYLSNLSKSSCTYSFFMKFVERSLTIVVAHMGTNRRLNLLGFGWVSSETGAGSPSLLRPPRLTLPSLRLLANSCLKFLH